MKPIKLEFSAFGPFVQRQTIEFSRFEKTGVFLIHGETGAGKTVILDAMTYALYGKSSGGVRGDMTTMRCQFADVSEPTEVSFDFEVQGKRYRFCGSLKARKKRNGTVEYIRQQDAFYQEKDGTYVPFFENPKMRYVEEKAQELLGLGYEQFIQVVILPQGKFEQLLLANSEEKEKILVRLFHADRWQKTAELLCTQMNEEKRTLEQKRAAIQQGMMQFGCDDLEMLSQYLTQKQVCLTEKQQEQALLFGQWEQQGQRLQQARVVEQMFCRLEEKEKQWQRLQLRQTEIREKEKQLQKAKQLQQVMPLYERWKQERERAVQLRTRRNALVEEYRAVKTTAEQWRKRELRLEAGRESYEKTQASLAQNEKIEEQYHQIKQAEQDREAAKQNCEMCRKEWEQCREERNRLQRERETVLQARQTAMMDYVAKIPLYRQKLQEQEKLREAENIRKQQREEIENLREQWETAKKQSAELLAAAENKEQQYQAALRHQAENFSRLLAEQLRDGEPCPVCGSKHHPAPAQKIDMNHAEDAERLRTEAAQTRETLFVAQQEERRLAEKIQELEKTVSEEVPEVFSAALYDRQKQLLQQAEAEENKLPQYEAELAAVGEQAEERRQTEMRLEANYHAAQKAEMEAERQYARICAQNGGELPEEKALQTTLNWQRNAVCQFETEQKEIRENMNACRLKLEGLQASGKVLQQEAEQAEQNETAAQEAWKRKTEEVQLVWSDELLHMQMNAETMETAELAVREYQTEYQVCKQARREYREKLENVPRPDLVAMEAEEQRLQQQHLLCAQEVSVLQEEVQRIAAVLKKLEKETALLREKEQLWQQNQIFAHMLRGDSGVSLQRYVLGVMLSSIIAEANKMLRQVHDGRYQLFRTLDTTGRTRKAGLELEVFDGRTGMRRGVASLSGGEKFLVSLALSLGLSAVVQMGCGGIRLQAMFIDEGFGTLDESSVADALQILTGMRHRDSIVGVISHIPMLKENIHCGIEVSKYHNGSKLKTVF